MRAGGAARRRPAKRASALHARDGAASCRRCDGCFRADRGPACRLQSLQGAVVDRRQRLEWRHRHRCGKVAAGGVRPQRHSRHHETQRQGRGDRQDRRSDGRSRLVGESRSRAGPADDRRHGGDYRQRCRHGRYRSGRAPRFRARWRRRDVDDGGLGRATGMKFGIFYELQLPKPWGPDDERQLVQDALAQVELADRLGLDYAWAVEHHFLEEYSHCSASDVFLAAAAARTKRIRLGHGIRQVIPNYNHPARTAEAIAMLDLVSNERAELGIGEGATRLELGGFNIPAKEKRAMSLEAAEQIANMMVMTPYPGFEGRSFKFPCRNVIPKPMQKPHPPMWMACTNRDTIKIAASHGLGALAFAFIDEAEARTWSQIYYY